MASIAPLNPAVLRRLGDWKMQAAHASRRSRSLLVGDHLHRRTPASRNAARLPIEGP